MKTFAFLIAIAAAACGSKTPAPAAPAEPVAAPTTPESPCHKQCMEHGPDDSPTTAEAWPGTSAEEKESECGMACSDAQPPD